MALGARELALMKPTAYLVNTARGPMVDADSLAAALRSGSIAGAAIDTLLGAVFQVQFRCAVCGVLTERAEHCGVLARVDGQPVWSVVCLFVERSHRRRAPRPRCSPRASDTSTTRR